MDSSNREGRDQGRCFNPRKIIHVEATMRGRDEKIFKGHFRMLNSSRGLNCGDGQNEIRKHTDRRTLMRSTRAAKDIQSVCGGAEPEVINLLERRRPIGGMCGSNLVRPLQLMINQRRS